MIKTLLLMLSLLPCLGLAAEAQALSPAASVDELSDEDVYYAPIDDSVDAITTTAQALPQGAFLSRASIHAFDIATGKAVTGAEVFVAGAYLGPTPLQLKEHVVPQPQPPVAVHMDGYAEGLRPAVNLPSDGPVSVALASNYSAGWYTTPAWVLGLGLLAASAAVYDAKNSGPGLALAGGGLAVISLSQLAARFMHLPALRRRADAYNAQPQPVPADGSAQP